MAQAGRTGYDNREIVMKYIHYKLSQRGYEWDVGDVDAAPLGAAPTPGIFSFQPESNPTPAVHRDMAARTSPLRPIVATTGPTLSPVPPVVHLTLRRAGDDFSRRYRRDFAEMSSQLHLTPFTARGRFATVVEELFRDGVNWGRIVAFFEFGGVMCVESVNREMSPLVDNIALWMTEYLNRHLHTWIQDNGGWTETMEELSMANTMFALNILKHIEKTNSSQNIFLSPWSISSTLAMVFLGARGDTEHQMAEVLQFNKVGGYDITTETPEKVSGFDFTQQIQRGNYPDAILQAQARDKVHSSFNLLSSAINSCSGDYLLESANKLFGEKSARFKEEYIQLCKKYYSTEPEAVDFLKCAEEARKKINSWVKTQTNGEIANLLPEGSVDEDTKMVLVNAVYFKGKWKTPFQKKLNELYPFHVNSRESIPVQMMHLREKLNIGYIQDLKTQILELPYFGNISMFLLLPDEIDDASTGLELLESEINFDKFNKWIGKDTMAEDDVAVYIPQFKLEQNYELKSILRSMGMEDAFDKSKANFSGMSQRNDLFLSEVFHQATVDVNEEGTIAAGGTGAVMTGRTGHGGPQFVADHPFIFFIINKVTNMILFYGRFSSP